MIIGIDHGFGQIKTAKTDMVTSVASYALRPAVTSPRLLTCKGADGNPVYHELGGRRTTLRPDKTVDEVYWLLTLGAIAQEIDARNADHKQTVTIAAGLPIHRFSEEVPRFRTYLNRRGPHAYSVGDREYEISIDGVQMYPQGYAALIPYMEDIKKEALVHLIDIGSWTTDTITLEHGTLVARSERSIEDGVIRCLDMIREEIRVSDRRTLTDQQIEDVLWRQADLPDSLIAHIRTTAQTWADTMVAYLREVGYDIASAPVYFVGGGAMLMLKYLSKRVRDQFLSVKYKTDIHANAVGYELACAAQRAHAGGAA